MFCSNCGTQLNQGARFCSGCGTAVGGTNVQQQAASSPASDASPQVFADFDKQVMTIFQAGRLEGAGITDALFQHALALYNKLENDPIIRNHPKNGLMRAYLIPYHAAQIARLFLQNRWAEDRRGRGTPFQVITHPLVLNDYIALGKAKDAWALFDYLQITSAIIKAEGVLMVCPKLLVYINPLVLEDMFIELLMCKVDPKAHKDAYSGLRSRYGDYPDRLLARLDGPAY